MTPDRAADLMARYLAGKASPEEMADLAIPESAIDLRTIPGDEWINHLQGQVRIPDDLRRFVEGQTTFSREELDGLEDQIAAFYHVQPPFYITCESGPPFEAWLGKE